LKVARLEIENFRGIAGQITIDLTNKAGEAASVLLLGDNGAGKSSVVDAIEFALRGRLSRRSLEGAKRRREVRSFAQSGPPGVVVELSDGREVRRGGGLRSSELPVLKPTAVVVGFQNCPLIVRRHDIESFWAVDPQSRQEFFFDYLRDPNEPIVPEHVQIEREEAYLRAEGELRTATRQLENLTGEWGARFPTTLRGSKAFLHVALLPKFGVKTAKGRRLPKDMWTAFLTLQRAIDKRNRAEGNRLPEVTHSVTSGPGLKDVLTAVAARVSEDFVRVTRVGWLTFIEISIGAESQLDVTLVLSSGKRVDPVQVLSEASLDLLATLILIEVHIACGALGQAKVIVLDDVFQSVDSVHRVRALDHIVARLNGWQVVLTLHDRLWLELTRSAFSRAGRQTITIELRSTEFGEPPLLLDARIGPASDLERALADGASSATVAGATGLLLEQLCDRLSISLATSVTRRRGDRYTLGDLWPGVESALKKHGGEALKPRVEEVARFMGLRNIAGAHYNEWALSLARDEAIDFAQATLALVSAVTCAACGAPLTKFVPVEGSKSFYDFQCKCAAPIASKAGQDLENSPASTGGEAPGVNDRASGH